MISSPLDSRQQNNTRNKEQAEQKLKDAQNTRTPKKQQDDLQRDLDLLLTEERTLKFLREYTAKLNQLIHTLVAPSSTLTLHYQVYIEVEGREVYLITTDNSPLGLGLD